MNLIRVRKIIIFSLINILVFISLWFLIEILNYVINPFNKESNRITCSYNWVLYNYCPNIVDVKKNSFHDGSEVVFSFSNSIGQRVKKIGDETNSLAKNIFIGDSFIQAEEIPYEETFYGKLAEKHNINAIGYSSWNVIEYIEVIKKLSLKNTNYHVFIMPNDVLPLYSRSVYGERNLSEKRIQDLYVPKGLKAELSKAYSNSITWKLMNSSFTAKEDKKALTTLNIDKFSETHIQDCSPLAKVPEEYKKTMGYGYLEYSKRPFCWDDLHTEAAKLALNEIKKMSESVKNLDSELFLYLIPPGWSFKNQNTIGRKNNEYYFFGDNIKVTTKPMFLYFSSSLPDIKFINLEIMINNWILDCSECKDHLYFSEDGHWTKKMHSLLFDYFSKNLN